MKRNDVGVLDTEVPKRFVFRSGMPHSSSDRLAQAFNGPGPLKHCSKQWQGTCTLLILTTACITADAVARFVVEVPRDDSLIALVARQ